MKRYFDVQIRVGGEWKWAGVEPMGMTRRQARHCKARMALQPDWRVLYGAEAFRVAEIPAEGGR